MKLNKKQSFFIQSFKTGGVPLQSFKNKYKWDFLIFLAKKKKKRLTKA